MPAGSSGERCRTQSEGEGSVVPSTSTSTGVVVSYGVVAAVDPFVAKLCLAHCQGVRALPPPQVEGLGFRVRVEGLGFRV